MGKSYLIYKLLYNGINTFNPCDIGKTSVPVGKFLSNIQHLSELSPEKQYFSNTLQFHIIKTHRSSNSGRKNLLTAKAQFPVLILHPVVSSKNRSAKHHVCSPRLSDTYRTVAEHEEYTDRCVRVQATLHTGFVPNKTFHNPSFTIQYVRLVVCKLFLTDISVESQHFPKKMSRGVL